MDLDLDFVIIIEISLLMKFLLETYSTYVHKTKIYRY